MSSLTIFTKGPAMRLGTAALLCALSLSGCKKADKAGKADAEDADTPAVAVEVQHPSIGPISEEITADAILAPLSQASVASRISAPILAEYVQRGARVSKGQVLLRLDARDLQGSALDSQGAVQQAEAGYRTMAQATVPEDLQKARLDVQSARANLDVANRTAEERKRLLREGAIAGRETDTAIAAAVQAQTAYDTAVKHLAGVQSTTQRTSLQTAQGQLTSARGRLESAEAQLSYATLRSPIAGVVTERPFFPGDTASAGTTLVTVMETSSLLAKLHLAQASAQKLKLGGSAELEIPGVAEPQPASISFISPALDPGSTTVEVWLRLSNPGGAYKVGTPVHAVIRGYTVANAVQVPAGAVVPADDGSTDILVVSSDSTVHKKPVTVGLRTQETVQILTGVSPADTVVTSGGYGLSDGTKVKTGGDDSKGDDNKSDASKSGDKD